MEKLLKNAEAWVGYLEKGNNSQLESLTANAGDKNYTVFAKKYNDYFSENYQGQPWCAMFVSCVFFETFGNDRVMPHFSYCPYGVKAFKQRNAFYSEPEPGDVIFFTNGERACHTGIVTGTDKKSVYTIEGNTSSSTGVVANGGCVAKKSYLLSNKKILGYGRPEYKEVTAMSVFSDCAGHFAQAHIEKLWDYGIINGRNDGLFHPDEPITRAEAAVMIANALSICGK